MSNKKKIITKFSAFLFVFSGFLLVLLSPPLWAAPFQVEPINNQTISSESVSLEWVYCGSSYYSWQLITSSGSLVTGQTNGSTVVTVSDLTNGQHQWRVAGAIDGPSSCQEWSSWQYFTINAETNEEPNAYRQAPSNSPFTIYTGTQQSFTVRATDINNNLDKVVWKIGNSTQETDNLSGGDDTDTWSYTFNTADSYYIYAYVYDDENENDYVYWQVNVVSPPNNPPTISNGRVSPTSGNTETPFYFYVDFYDSDNDLPASIQAVVNGTARNMGHYSGSIANGTYYYGPINLPQGSINYYFTCSDGNGGTDREPETGSHTVDVAAINNAPQLSNGTVSPTSGTVQDNFKYTVHYYDADGHSPSEINVKIDDSSKVYGMTLESGTAANGTYAKSVEGSVLGIGGHGYQFWCEDGNGKGNYYRGADGGDINGPDVEAVRKNLDFTYFDTTPRNVDPGGYVTAQIKIRNTGNVSVPECEHLLFVNNIQDNTGFTFRSIPRAVFSTPALDPDQETELIEIEFKVPEVLAPGWDYYAVLHVDWEDQIQGETSDSDNFGFAPIIGDEELRGTKLGSNNNSSFSGDPVNTALGNFTYEMNDLNIPGVGLSLSFTRYYNSQGGLESPLGVYWSHSYNIYVHEDVEESVPTGSYTLVYGDGKRHRYTPDGNGGFDPPNGIHDIFTKNDDGSFAVTHKSQTRYEFFSNGKLSAIQDRNDNAISFNYTGGLLSSIIDTVGRQVDLSYETIDGASRLVSIQGPLKPSVNYSFDGYGNLKTVTDPRENTTTYQYVEDHDDKHLMASIINRRGKTEIENTYGLPDGTPDLHGFHVVAQSVAGDVTAYQYDIENGVTYITGPDNLVTKHYYDTQYRFIKEEDPLGNILEFHFDENGNRDWIKDKKGFATYFTHGSNGNVLTKTDPKGAVTKIEYNELDDPTRKVEAFGALDYEWIYTYDANGNLEKETDPEGNETIYTYYPTGQLKTRTDANGNTKTYYYEDAHQNLTKTIGPSPSSCETIYTYDDAGRKITVTDGLGNKTTYHYDDNDNLEWVKNPEGITTYYEYDENDNKLSVTDGRGNKTQYSYDDKDRLVTVKDPLLKETNTEYDAFDRKIKTIDPWGNITSFEYDEMGNLKEIKNAKNEITRYDYDKNGNKIKMIDAAENEWEYGYDENNRLIWEEDPLNNRTSNEYNELGWVAKFVDAKSNETTFDYYKNGKLKKVLDPESGQTVFTYDGVGNILTEQDARGFAIEYQYDEKNRVKKVIDRNGNTTTFGYDCVNMTSKTDGNGETIQYPLYDKNNRLKSISYPGSTTVSFTYDENGNRKTMTDSLGTTSYAYDALDRLTSVQDPYGKTVGYTYSDSVDKRSIIYPDGKTVNYEFDELHRLWKVEDWAGYTTTYGYDNRGNLSSVTNTKGTTVDYGYDDASRLVTLADRTSSNAVISSFAYTLDKVGNRTNATMDLPIFPNFSNESISANYDDENQIINWGSTTFDFDDAGRQVSKSDESTKTYTFNHEDRLTKVVNGSETYDYKYNGLGDRLSRSVNGVEKRYVLDLNGDMSRDLCETDSNGDITAYYVHGTGLLYKISPSGERHHYHFDPIGSTIALTDGNETITDKYAYDPFGKLQNSDGNTENPFRYVGQYGVMDEDNGLLFMRARFYDSTTKRFLSRDPVRGEVKDTQRFNMYLYALNNPTIYNDPSGRMVPELFDLAFMFMPGGSIDKRDFSGLARTATGSMAAIAEKAFIHSAIASKSYATIAGYATAATTATVVAASLVSYELGASAAGLVHGIYHGYNEKYEKPDSVGPSGGAYFIGNCLGGIFGGLKNLTLRGTWSSIGKLENAEGGLAGLYNKMLKDATESYSSPSVPSLGLIIDLSVKANVSPKTLLMQGKSVPGAWGNLELWKQD